MTKLVVYAFPTFRTVRPASDLGRSKRLGAVATTDELVHLVRSYAQHKDPAFSYIDCWDDANQQFLDYDAAFEFLGGQVIQGEEFSSYLNETGQTVSH